MRDHVVAEIREAALDSQSTESSSDEAAHLLQNLPYTYLTLETNRMRDKKRTRSSNSRLASI